jgi:hypothetical protein
MAGTPNAVHGAFMRGSPVDSRPRGAGPVLIGARANDTPKQMYAALGFRPLCIQRSYVKTGLSQT